MSALAMSAPPGVRFHRMPSDFNEALREWAAKHKLSRPEVAEILGASYSSVVRYLEDESSPRRRDEGLFRQRMVAYATRRMPEPEEADEGDDAAGLPDDPPAFPFAPGSSTHYLADGSRITIQVTREGGAVVTLLPLDADEPHVVYEHHPIVAE